MTRKLTTEERAAFAEMLKPHHEYLARFCSRLCRSDEDGPLSAAFTSKTEGVMINSGQFDGTPVSESINKVTTWLEEKGLGKAASLMSDNSLILFIKVFSNRTK